MNTFDIKLNEPLTLSFTGPKGDVFKMTVSCDGVVVTPPSVTSPVTLPSAESDVAKKAAEDVKAIVDAMIGPDPTTLRKIGTAYYTLKLNNLYTIEAESSALAKIVGYEPASFITVFNNAIEADRPEVCIGIIDAIQTALVKAGLPGVY